MADIHLRSERFRHDVGARACAHGSYERSFSLDGVDTDAIKASFTNGVLTLTMPKRIEPKVVGRRLEIEG